MFRERFGSVLESIVMAVNVDCRFRGSDYVTLDEMFKIGEKERRRRLDN